MERGWGQMSVTAPLCARPSPAPACEPELTGPIPGVVLEDELGRGGMGAVFRGRQEYLDRPVAVKVLLAGAVAADPAGHERFKREAKALARLSHPHIVTCHLAGCTGDGTLFLVMELIEGPDLKRRVAEGGPLSAVAALTLARELALAQRHARQHGIIHRDVKPDNVLLERLPDEAAAGGARDPAFPFGAKLIDLGLARAAVASPKAVELTGAGVVVGTPTTMAPEQVTAPESVDFRADIFGLGCVLFYALTGERAFEGDSATLLLVKKLLGTVRDPLRLRPDLHPAIGPLLSSMLAPDPGDRPASYDELLARIDEVLALVAGSAAADALAEASAEGGGEAEAETPAGPLLRRRGLRRLALAAGGAVLALVAAAARGA